MRNRRIVYRIAVVVSVLVATGMASAAVVIETVPVGDAGNTADTAAHSGNPAGQGSVAYGYRIGKYEVTNAQYRYFLNHKAAVGDPYGLYCDLMGTDYGGTGGIARSGSGTTVDPWVYTAKGGDATWDNKPVVFVGFWNAVRFCNWLSNGQGDGSTEAGSYVHLNQSSFARTPQATWVVPTEDEWYKAAYYKGRGLDSGYWEYATQSEFMPANVRPEFDTGNAACYWGQWTCPVGSYQLSVGPYGTYDQNGNAGEWTEAVAGAYGELRIVRGGAGNESGDMLRADRRYGNYEENRGPEYVFRGFRVAELDAAAVPLPGAAWMAALVLPALMARRPRRRR